jgi:glyoxylase-like metal-dependent hydrolase (beta-lactamase superfamily II)
MQPVQLNERIYLIDGFDLGQAGRTGTYVILEDQITLVETCASPSIPYIMEGLKALQIHPEDIKYIIVTHIHLDHAGGAGLLLEKCPNAKLIVHPKGSRHLMNPSRLIEGAKAVYGEQFEKLYHPVVPVPENRIIIKNDGDTLEIGKHCMLTFYDTPGHANHHFSIYDSVSKGIFTGDTIGVFYHQLLKYGVELYLPSTSPNQFRPDEMIRSAKKIAGLQIDAVYFGHFGMSKNFSEVINQLEYWLPLFIQIGDEGINEVPNGTLAEQAKLIAQKLTNLVLQFLQSKHIPKEDPVFDIINLDLQVCAMGIADYFQRQKNNLINKH